MNIHKDTQRPYYIVFNSNDNVISYGELTEQSQLETKLNILHYSSRYWWKNKLAQHNIDPDEED